MHNKCVKLFQPPLLDFSKIQKNDDVKIVIYNAQHKFATNAEFSGVYGIKQPIFGSIVYINDKKFLETSFGLPFIRFVQGSEPKITYENTTKFTFNIHYHGLNTVGSTDGTSMEIVFGPSTLLGPIVTFQFPKITNNYCLLWEHAHNMFTSMELIYGGIVGLLQITDKQTEWLTKDFKYGDNQLLLLALDMDFTKEGTQTFTNLVSDQNRSCFGVINGTSAVTWYGPEPVKFVNPLYHTTTKTLVKIDILNASLNSRVFHVGVCDKHRKVKSFYLVQTDSGLMNPKKLKMATISVASRVGIIIDLDKFENETAHLFFYDYDLTEIFETMPTFPEQPNNPSLTAKIPDLNIFDPTPYPSQIPDMNEQNQQDNQSNLDYPYVNLIHQTEQILENGSIPTPANIKAHQMKPFLRIELDEKFKKHHKQHELSMDKTLAHIRKTVFGNDNYEEYKSHLKRSCFEYNPKYNYLSFLNKNYFYNIPKFDTNVPTRNLFLFSETNINTITGGNLNGTTEFVNGGNRIMADLWNSDQLNLDWALEQYKNNNNNYKPKILPSSKFRIYKTNDKYSNTAMISNDTLKIQIFTNEVAYGDYSQQPLANVNVIFPPNNFLNIQEWINVVNHTFKQTQININELTLSLDNILECDWSFFPYAMNFLYQKTAYIKSAVIKTKNNSKYWIRLLGRWPLLQFFGKSLAGNTLDESADLITQLRIKEQKLHKKIKNKHNLIMNIKESNENITTTSTNNRLPPIKSKNLYAKCDEVGTYGIYDAEIQQFFPFYATADGNVQLPIACMKRNAELIIAPSTTYIGSYDGYFNDNLNSFSVKLHSSEQWIYSNGDKADAHPIHFHMTSGYSSPQSNFNSAGLVSCKNLSNQLTYSKDIYQIGPQETVSFYLTWPYYSSNDMTELPPIKGIGGVIHCHFLQHNDMNSMIVQYFIDP